MLIEARRMTRKELQHEPSELLGKSLEEPSELKGGEGYNYPRLRKQIRRAEAQGATPFTQDRISKMSSLGIRGSSAHNIQKLPKIIRKPVGLAKLRLRALRQRGERGYHQDISKMAKGLKQDPSQFPPVITISPDDRHKKRIVKPSRIRSFLRMPQKPQAVKRKRETAMGGRTRMATATAVGAEPEGITIPSKRYAGSAERFKKAAASGKLQDRFAQLKAQGKTPRGQDPRLYGSLYPKPEPKPKVGRFRRVLNKIRGR